MRFNDLNASELALLAQEENNEAHRGIDRDVLIRIAEGELIELPKRPVSRSRDTLGRVILERWEQYSPILTCPAKNRNLRACYTCTDIQAVECAFWNENVIKE